MKTSSAALFALLGLLSAPITSSIAADSPRSFAARAFNVSAVNPQADEQIVRGAEAATVRRHLGAPDRILSRNVWAYFNHLGDHPATAAQGCTTLIVTFNAANQVSDLKLANSTAVKVIADNTRRGSSLRFATADFPTPGTHASAE